ncbi:MAG: RNA-directed DNA polymerase [Clostridiales bacterium]|nr:RNA-directed DNA polymerase [Clostridiales bacterium]
MGNFKDIATRNELADFLGFPRRKLSYILYVKSTDAYYQSFTIPKKSGGERCINAPTGDLKDIQKKLAMALWKHQLDIRTSRNIRTNISHAFEKGKGIISNAQIHRNKRYVLNLDLKNFFSSFHFGRVKGYFEKNRDFELPNQVATVIAQLTCFQGCLPQGAPTSPIITNMICQILDMKLLRIAKRYKLDYSRYADDLTFSTNNRAFLGMQSEFYEDVAKEVTSAGFTINEKKTRLQYKDSKQVVTGLIVNKKLNVDRIYARKTKAMAHTLYTNGEYTIDGKIGTLKQLEGRFAFINQLDKYNNKRDGKGEHKGWNLNSREKQYQKFLFYKYFFSNSKPIIVTEGKTDVVYMKAALRKLHAEYPCLIERKPDGTFEYHVSFLKRSKRLSYFLHISQDGADTMKNLFNFFSPTSDNKRVYPDYLTYFMKAGNCSAQNPVILVFDNELSSKNKPIKKFSDHVKLDDVRRETLKRILHLKLIDKGNLYLLTNPLVDGKDECEIEDLFDENTLSQVIDGRTFSRDIKKGDTQHYGKETFSMFVSRNHMNIDFSRFREMLNILNEIIGLYHKPEV